MLKEGDQEIEDLAMIGNQLATNHSTGVNNSNINLSEQQSSGPDRKKVSKGARSNLQRVTPLTSTPNKSINDHLKGQTPSTK